MIEEIFKAALCKILNELPYGSKSGVARAAGISRQQLNNIEVGRVMGDETQRRAIAGALGYAGRAYEDFLDIGRSLLNIAADDDVHTFFRAALCKSLRKTTFSQRADLARYCNLNVGAVLD